MSSLIQELADLAEELKIVSKESNVKLSAGGTSKFYIDCIKFCLHPRVADKLTPILIPMVVDSGAKFVGGLTLGADAPVTLVTGKSILGGGDALLGFFVRKEPKNHGTQRLIEGWIEKKANVALIDGVCTTGASFLKTMRIVTGDDYKCKVVKMITIFNRCEGGIENLEKAGYELKSLLEITSEGKIVPASQ